MTVMPTRFRETLLNVATITVTICAIGLAAVRVKQWVSPAQAKASDRRISHWATYAAKGHRIGPADAQVTIVEFADFQCPYCRLAAPALHELLRWYPGKVAIVYRHLPVRTHTFAEAAAVAVECASEQGRFEAMHDTLYSQAKLLGVKPWSLLAAEAGVPDTTRFASCLRSTPPLKRLQEDREAAALLGFRGTPAFLINGAVVNGYPGFEALNQQVEALLRAARDGGPAQRR
ncbi:MAG: DsbA family protein [Gemmatimonadaceae bacterium]